MIVLLLVQGTVAVLQAVEILLSSRSTGSTRRDKYDVLDGSIRCSAAGLSRLPATQPYQAAILRPAVRHNQARSGIRRGGSSQLRDAQLRDHACRETVSPLQVGDDRVGLGSRSRALKRPRPSVCQRPYAEVGKTLGCEPARAQNPRNRLKEETDGR
ncbi:hypothetical protein V8C44DRAFT_135512 [Trichoderma aethiopicum]